ncbi:MAG TPA: hypothetical protein VEC08_02025 [Nitrososphaerales archaeon]|nr:hypothetical protein [Nitrososphaerales archaeon]
MSRNFKSKRYPYPSYDVDLTGFVKIRTLEFFVMNQGWHTPERFQREVALGKWEDLYPLSRAVEMRFLRYTRSDLLERRKTGRRYEYTITRKGEQRWIYLLKKRGLLDPERAKTLQEKNLVSTRREVVLALLEKHKMNLEEKLSHL